MTFQVEIIWNMTIMNGPFLKSQNLQFEFIKEEVGYGTIDLVRM